MSGGSRVTDEMVDAAIDAYEMFRSKGLGLGTQRSRARAAIEAALSHQAPAVAVSDLEALKAYYVSWGYQELEPCDWSDPANGDVVIHLNDLRTLINKAGSDE